MTEIRYSNPQEFRDRFPGDAFRLFEGFEIGLAEAMFVRAVAGVAKRTPRAQTLRNSYGKQSSSGQLAASMATDKQDRRYTVGLTDPKANALDIGRKMSKPFSRRIHAIGTGDPRGRRGRLLGEHGTALYSRRLGSKQASRGIMLPTGFSLKAAWNEILAEAAAKAGGSEE